MVLNFDVYESWRIEVYQIGYYDLGLDNRIKQMVWY